MATKKLDSKMADSKIRQDSLIADLEAMHRKVYDRESSPDYEAVRLYWQRLPMTALEESHANMKLKFDALPPKIAQPAKKSAVKVAAKKTAPVVAPKSAPKAAAKTTAKSKTAKK